MKAMVFAAGLGTRLRPLTNDRPKALVEVGGKTMLERVITHLAYCGVTDITVNIHHFGEKIIEFLEEKTIQNNDKITVFNTDLFCLNFLKLIAVDKSVKSAII